jgi:hypothetical protein
MTAPVQASRLALVIGNGYYKYSQPLNCPVNDAKDMATVLRGLGFTVIDEYNLKHQDFDQAVDSFENQLHKYNVGLFYFSGHGLQAQGDNYLMPIDAQIQSTVDIKYKSINANQILDKMEYANKRTNLLILDACRNNPFKSLHKGLSKGLAEMSPMGSLIAFATAPSMTALDGLPTDRNSIYTKHLLKQLQMQPHLSVLDLLTRVAGGVAKETNQKQWPWKSDSLTDIFYFAQATSQQKSQIAPEIVADLSPPPPVPDSPPSYRYIDNGDGTVTDNRTGLIWLTNANCFGKQNWKKAMQSAANLASGQCGLRDGSRQGMWRLPSKEEWETMIDKKYVDRKNYSQPAFSNAAGTGHWKEGDAFSGVQAGDYWSSTAYVNNTSYAWLVNLDSGVVSTFAKTNTSYVWPLRGEH